MIYLTLMRIIIDPPLGTGSVNASFAPRLEEMNITERHAVLQSYSDGQPNVLSKPIQ
jgi:hypothetical protein